MFSGVRRWAMRPSVRLRVRRIASSISYPMFIIFSGYAGFLQIFMKRYLGQFLCFLVYGLLILVITSEFLVVIPYEGHMRPSILVPLYIVLAIYLIPNILFHYYKACTVDPGLPAKRNVNPWCHRCNNNKPDRAHHCSICARCVEHMDHHCVWINQCVGLRNHRYFFQFVVYVWLAMALILFSNYDCFWEHLPFLENSKNMPYCLEDLEMAPWRDWACRNFAQAISGCIFFDYGLAILLFLVLGGFAIWLAYLISIGETLIELLSNTTSCCPCKGRVKSPYDLGFVQNWKRFFGLTKGRSFVKYVLLPSSHAETFEEFTLEHARTHVV